MTVREAYILSPADIRHIRSYVHHKYAGLQQEQRVEIFADAVSRVIRKQLPDFDEPTKASVTAKLIRIAIAEGQRPIGLDDILDLCLTLEYSDDITFLPLHNWIERQLQITCDQQQLRYILNNVKESQHPNRENSWKQLLKLVSSGGLTLPSETQPADLPPDGISAIVRRYPLGKSWMYLVLCVALTIIIGVYHSSLDQPLRYDPLHISQVNPAEDVPAPGLDKQAWLPSAFSYRMVNEEKLIAYLESRQSILAQKPYLDAIIEAAQSFNIHPLLLFAITGQEQGFVPTTNKRYKEIANNPFNVFHSWQDFNTTISQSAEIAARTIINASKDRPQDADPLKWINRTYAEDPKWSDGVRAIFEKLTEVTQ